MERIDFLSTGKIKLGFSSYTYARVSVMKSFLFKREDYDRILKMGANEVLRFLQDTHYKKEMDDYDVSTQGINVIDNALNANLMRNFKKLYKISDKNMQKVLSAYFLRYDMENIKIILRSKFAGLSPEEVFPLLFDSVNYNQDFLNILLAKNNVDEIVSSIYFLKTQKSSSNNLFEIENLLDRYYVESLTNLASNLRGQGKIIISFLEQEVDLINTKTILRLKSGDFGDLKNSQQDYLINPSQLVKRLLNKSSIEEIVKELNKQKYTSLNGDEKDILTKLEIDLSVAVLKKSILLVHQNVLSANYILGYLFAKEIEVKNLKTIIKGKKLEISSEYLGNLMVVAK